MHEKVLNSTLPQGKANETTMKHLTVVRMAVIKKTTNTGGDVEGGIPCAPVGRNKHSPCGGTVWQLLRKPKIDVPYGIPLLAVCSKEVKACERESCVHYSSSQDTEAASVSRSGSIRKRWYVCGGLLLSHKKEHPVIFSKMDIITDYYVQ